jgi:maltose alpha-D-glucosyltransferase/alpha-amylase
MGVDGMRLDAVPYLYEREGTNCENLPETHEFLRSLRRHLDEKFRNRMLLAEANQWPEDSVAYFGDGDACHMAFHFPIMPRLFMSLHMEDRYPIIDILDQTPAIPDNAQWALFLRNHDELTLEMVTDEERDYMYRVYAHDPQARINLGIRRRLAPLLGNDRRRVELMNGLLFSLPGTPVLYYGDEIGMGDNFYLGDRNGVRTPMQWSADRNAGFSRANPQRLYLPIVIDPEYHYETVNVEAQEQNPHSLLWWTKRLIALRKRFQAFGRGSIEFLHPSNRKVLAFLRVYHDEHILIVANLSRFVQYVELDLSRYRDQVAVELFGGTEFPPIGDLPYLLTLGPHAFYWFQLQPQRQEITVRTPDEQLTRIAIDGDWRTLFEDDGRALEQAFRDFLPRQRWFGGKARRIREVAVADVIPIRDTSAVLSMVQVEYTEGDPERYNVPISTVTGEDAARIRRDASNSVIAVLTAPLGEPKDEDHHDAILVDAAGEPSLRRALLETIRRRRRMRGDRGHVSSGRTRALKSLLKDSEEGPASSVAPWEQSNTSFLYDKQLVLKLFRRLGDGLNPDLEIGRFLTDRAGFEHSPPVAGHITYDADGNEPVTLAVLQGFVANEGDAWQFTLDEVERYFERVLIHRRTAGAEIQVPDEPLLHLATLELDQATADIVGTYLEAARIIGERTAQLHRALSSSDDPAFAPEPFTRLYQRSLYQSLRAQCTLAFSELASAIPGLAKDMAGEAEQVLKLKNRALQRLRVIADRKLKAQRIRCHGDYHLGQLLWTGRDFVIVDFEGEPARPVGERRIKRSPLRDVAGMLRSFHYAAATVFKNRIVEQLGGPADVASVAPWADYWYRWTSATFLRSYLAGMEGTTLLPSTQEEIGILLDAYLLDKAFYELRYELHNRPNWTWIPIQGVQQVLSMPPGS